MTRPVAVRLDLGGSAKGLAADLAAERLHRYSAYTVDAGGDIRVGGEAPQPRLVRVAHPMRVEPAHTFELTAGAVATSGIAARVWATEDGYAHHLIDPSTGAPAWTGLAQATALGATGVEAEALAKAALLSGPSGAARFLGEHGGVAIADDGGVELYGGLAIAIGGLAA